jgi:hypothetical protein
MFGQRQYGLMVRNGVGRGDLARLFARICVSVSSFLSSGIERTLLE